MKQDFTIMRRRVYLLVIIFLLGLLLFMVTKQFMGYFYWRMAYQDGKELHKIIVDLEKSVAIDYKNALFHFSLGRAYLRKALTKSTNPREGKEWIRKSIDEFHKAIDLNPSSSDYHFHLAISYGSLAYPPPFYWKVIQNSFERTAALNPTDSHHLYSIGIYYLNEYQQLKNVNGTDEKGISSYKNYLVLLKGNYQSFFKKLLDVNEEYLGKILKKCFSVTEEYIDLKGVIKDTASNHSFLAWFLNCKGMWEGAKKEYRKAINLDPNNPTYYSSFAHALFKRGYYKNAIHWWQKQKVLDPQDENPYLFSADGFMKLKQFDDALREIRDLIAIYPENINYQVKLIKSLLVAHRYDEAIDEYYKLMEKNQNFSRPMYDTIRYYQEKGNYPKAIKTLNEALLLAVNK